VQGKASQGKTARVRDRSIPSNVYIYIYIYIYIYMRGTRGSGAFGRINGYLPAAAAAVAAVAAAAATRKRRMMIRTVDSAKTGEERKEGSRSKVIAVCSATRPGQSARLRV